MYKVGDKGILSHQNWNGSTFVVEITEVDKEHVSMKWKQLSGKVLDGKTNGTARYNQSFFKVIFSPLTKLHKVMYEV